MTLKKLGRKLKRAREGKTANSKMPKTLAHIPAASRKVGFMMKFYANRTPEIMLSFGLAGAGKFFLSFFSFCCC